MLMRIFVAIVIIFAIIAGFIPYIPVNFINTAFLHNFFQTTLPILGFGALVKYLCSSCECK
jgi:hypothetical protein